MKMGVFTVPFAHRPFGEALDVIKATGCEAVETGTGGAPGNAHCDLDYLVENNQAPICMQPRANDARGCMC